MCGVSFVIIGIKHGFSCINIRQVPWEVLKTVAEGRGFQHLPSYLANVNGQVPWDVLKTMAEDRGFQHLPRDLTNVNALKKNMFDRYCIKTENICYISRYFLHYFVSPFHRCLANVISTDYARSRAGQYTPRNGSKSVAPVRSY